ncbi:MAG: FAD-dependent oxidoreductase, partial [Planctomycetota bacterium]
MWDVVVVGAGPAGCVAAFCLAKRGFEVLLLERKGEGRFKPCAGGLSGATVRMLSRLGIGVPDGWRCFGLRM